MTLAVWQKEMSCNKTQTGNEIYYGSFCTAMPHFIE